MFRDVWFPLWCSCLAAAWAGGCGYHLAGMYLELPAGIRTVYVPVVGNTTVSPETDEPVTTAFRERIAAAGFTAPSREQADSVLSVTVKVVDSKAISFDAASNVREYRLTITADIVLTAAGKKEPEKKLPNFSVQETYSAGASPEETNGNRIEAIEKAAKRLALDGLERILGGF